MIRVKVCGITTPDDARMVADAGADAVGLNFWPGSKRFVDPERAREIAAALPAFVTRVGVFVDAPADEIARICDLVRLDCVQLHGDEPPELARVIPRRVIRAIRPRPGDDLTGLEAYGASALLVDAYVDGMPGGTGRAANWALARQVGTVAPLVLAGGLTPDNVAAAVRSVRPYGVDVASGVESAPGHKDADLVRRFGQGAREALCDVAP